ncbi:MAG: hypothetical protein M3Y66_04845 [Actinomycetota bacterium]|nr:hypothetical protein [Actinomycetota bacterium]
MRENAINLRIVAAVAVLISAGVHLYLWFDVFRHTNVIGPAFLLNTAGGVLIALLLVRWHHWIPLVLAVGFGVSTLGAFVIASTAGLFGVHEHWTGWPVWTAAVSEVVAIAAGAVAMAHELPARSGGQLEDRLAVRRPHLH